MELKNRIHLVVVFVLALCTCCFSSLGQTTSEVPAKEIIVGRVLADVPRYPHGGGIGPLWQFLIFGVESDHGHNIKPVLVAYLHYNWTSDPPLRESFFDHSKLYELMVVRNRSCDQTVSSLSFIENETVTGEPLPPSPGISLVDGASKDALKRDLVLPCYTLRHGDYLTKKITARRTNRWTRAAGACFVT